MTILESAKKLMIIMSWGKLWKLLCRKVPVRIKLVLAVDYQDILKENVLKIEVLQVLDYVLAVAKNTIGAMSADPNKMQKFIPFTLQEMGKRACSRALKSECMEP